MENEKILEYQFKQNARIVALQTAERLNPSKNYVSVLSDTIEQEAKASTEDMIADADKIYTWLTKALD